MKKALLFLSVVLISLAFSTKTRAQTTGTFSINAVTGLPDTLNANGTYTFGFNVMNVGNTLYSGTISFDFYVDTLTPGTTRTFGTGQVGNFTPGDSTTIQVTYSFLVSNNDFHIGDNVVVVWPRGLNGSTAQDSLTFHVLIADLNGIGEPEKNNTNLKIFPNPVTNFVNVTSEKGKIETVKIFDLSGKMVLESQSPQQVFTGNLPQGVYVVEATLTDGTISQRRIIASNH